jgi:glycerate-2-kinase
MAWITLDETNVQTRLTGPELSALKSAALAPGQVNPLPEIIAKVIQEVRGRVAACQLNRIGAGSTIPDELTESALAIIRYRLLTRLPVASLLTDARREEYRDALRLLADVAASHFRIEQPSTPTTQIISGPATEVASKSERKATREKMRGL